MKPSFQIISFVLVCGIIAQLFGKYIVIAGFELNKEDIVKELCVQKEKPNNCCQGSCHLKKELEKQGETGANSQNQQKVKIEQEQNINSIYKFAPTIQLISVYDAKHNSITLFSFQNSIFHPPCIA